jgi:hypothetical protein
VNFYEAFASICGDRARSPVERLKQAAELVVRAAESRPDLFRLMLVMVYSGRNDHLWDWKANHGRMLEQLTRLVDEAKASGTIRYRGSSSALAFHWWEMAANVARARLFLPDLEPEALSTDWIFDLFLHGAAGSRRATKEGAR